MHFQQRHIKLQNVRAWSVMQIRSIVLCMLLNLEFKLSSFEFVLLCFCVQPKCTAFSRSHYVRSFCDVWRALQSNCPCIARATDVLRHHTACITASQCDCVLDLPFMRMSLTLNVGDYGNDLAPLLIGAKNVRYYLLEQQF